MKKRNDKIGISIIILTMVLALSTACSMNVSNGGDLEADKLDEVEENAVAQPDYEEKEVSLEKQLVNIDGVKNARQLGGYIGADGRKVKENLLFRSGQLSDITDEGIKSMTEEYGIKKVIDFRTEGERALSAEKQIDGIENIWLTVMELSFNSADTKKSADKELDKTQLVIEYAKSGLAESMYKDILTKEKGQQGYTQFFDILLNNDDGAVLWHCTQGKDRAGLASALVLYALGVDEETILKDFELSNEVYKDAVVYMENEARSRGCDEDTVKKVGYLTGVNPQYYIDAIEEIKEQYGSVEKYMNDELGVSQDDIKALRDKYLE